MCKHSELTSVLYTVYTESQGHSRALTFSYNDYYFSWWTFFFFGQRECRKQCLFIHLLIKILPKNQLFCVYLCHIADTLTHHYTSSMWLTLEFVRHQLAKFMICIILQDWSGNIKSLKLANLSRETNSINKIQKNLSLFTSV